MNSKRHRRQPNFSVKEEKILLDLVEENSKVIKCRKTDARSCYTKRRVWNEINSKFGVLSGVKRDVRSLTYKFENLKKKARRELARQRSEGNADADGQHTEVHSTERLAELLGLAKVECIETTVDCYNNSSDSIIIPKEIKKIKEPDDVHSFDDELLEQRSDADLADWNGFENTQTRTTRILGPPEVSDELLRAQMDKIRNEDMRAEEKFEWERRQADERHEWQRRHAEEKHEWERQQAQIKLQILMIELKNKEQN